MCLRFTGKTIDKNIECSRPNGLEPATHEKDQMPISNRLRPREILERNRCAIGWSYIYDHSTNPVKLLREIILQKLWLELAKKYALEPAMPLPLSSIIPTTQARQ